MGKQGKNYPSEFRRQLVELVRIRRAVRSCNREIAEKEERADSPPAQGVGRAVCWKREGLLEAQSQTNVDSACFPGIGGKQAEAGR